MFPEAKLWRADELRVGLTSEFERTLAVEDVLAFARLSGDFNPLHVSSEYAKQTNYRDRIAHGALQVGLASAMIGMFLPGRHVLLGSVNARFVAPLYFPAEVRVRAELSTWDLSSLRGNLRVVISDLASGTPTAEVQMGFTLHEPDAQAPQPKPELEAVASGERPVVLLTGASGGIGTTLLRALSHDYAVIALVSRGSISAELKALPHVSELRADLEAAALEETVGAVLSNRPLYAVVHAAWPGAPAGGLLEADPDSVERQVAFGSGGLIRLAKLLCARAQGQGRIVALGSIYGSQRPMLNLAAYSLGKATLESTVRLLAPELARKQITVNAVCPSFVPEGMNKHVNDRQRLKEAAQVPMGRLCSPEDVANAVLHLLSPGSGFISGQVLGLNGGQL